MADSSIIYNYERNTINSNSEKQHYNHLSSTFLIASILLMATFVAWPNQAAFAHDSGLHDLCWDQTLNAFEFLPDLVPIIFGFWWKVLALLVSIALGAALSLVCAPQIVPPPDNLVILPDYN